MDLSTARGRGPSCIEPKSAASRRVVALNPAAVAALRRHERDAKTSGWHGLDRPVFSTAKRKPVNPANLIARHFKPLLEHNDLPGIRFHDLRHTCATLLLGQGVHPKIVQELLGHASIQLTLDTYSHYLPHIQEKAVHAMQSALETPFEAGRRRRQRGERSFAKQRRNPLRSMPRASSFKLKLKVIIAKSQVE